MPWNVLAIRTAEDDDPTFFPVLGDEQHLVEFEPADGTNPLRIVAKAITVSERRETRWKEVAAVREIKAEVHITDARIVIACEKFDKGGGWTGFGTGAIVALGFNAVSKARAAIRRRGKVLVGHVRYPWLGNIGFMSKTGWLSEEQLQITCIDGTDGGKRRLAIELILPKQISARDAACEIARRAAAHRLNNDQSMKDEERVAFEELARSSPRAAQPKQYVFYRMPTFFDVTAKTAYPSNDGNLGPAQNSRPPESRPADVAQLPSGDIASGADRDKKPIVSPPTSRFCGACGTQRKRDAKFCGTCGAGFSGS